MYVVHFKTTCWGFDWVETDKNCTIYTVDEVNNTMVKSGTIHVKVGPFCVWSEYNQRYILGSIRNLPSNSSGVNLMCHKFGCRLRNEDI